MTVRQRIRVRRAGILIACFCTVSIAIVALYLWNGGQSDGGSLAQASTAELLSLLGLFIVPPITFAIMLAEQRLSGRRPITG